MADGDLVRDGLGSQVSSIHLLTVVEGESPGFDETGDGGGQNILFIDPS
jgi:hypothetical protein